MKALKGSPLVTPIITTVLIGVAVAIILIFQTIHYSQAVGDDVRSAIAADGQANIVVELGFEPEAFNVNLFQQYSNAVSVDGTRVRLFGVTSEDLSSIGRLFWVQSVELL